MKQAFIISFTLHAAVLVGSLLVRGPEPLPLPTEITISLNIAAPKPEPAQGVETPSPKAETVETAQAEVKEQNTQSEPKPEPKPEPVPKPEPEPVSEPESAPVPVEVNTLPTPRKKPKVIKPQPETTPQEPKPTPEPKPEPKADPKPEPKPEPEPEIKPEEDAFDLDAIATLIDKTKPKAIQDGDTFDDLINEALQGDKTAQGQGGQTPELIALNRLLRSTLIACWNRAGTPLDLPAVEVRFALTRNGLVNGSIDVISGEQGSGFAIAVERAKRAVKSCEPFDLPRDLYRYWQQPTFVFRP